MKAVAQLAFANPFGPARALAEREALGPEHVDAGPLWTPHAGAAARRENARRILARLEPLLGRLRERIGAGAAPAAADLSIYTEACFYLLYCRYASRLREHMAKGPARVAFYGDFARDLARLTDVPGHPAPRPAHLFACAFQICRARHHISTTLLGGSKPAARLRATVWESIFTHDLRRYLRTMYARMDEFSTLILGPTGTGKELVATAIGRSRFVPFDEDTGCLAIDQAAFHGLNLAALAPAVLESELFGHKRGSFTGAIADKPGWLSLGGTIFLDEIGEIAADIQVKLLRVIQDRIYHPVGALEPETFAGKLIAATHRDLPRLIKKNAFRLDLFMRICSDRIYTPSLREMLDAAPDERRALVRHLVEKATGPDEADALTDEVEAWIDAELPPDHPWFGNVRELEQCVNSRLVHHSCRPLDLSLLIQPDRESDEEAFARAFNAGALTARVILRRATTVVQAKTGSFRETAKRLGLDRRAVAENVDPVLLAKLVARRREDEDEDEDKEE